MADGDSRGGGICRKTSMLKHRWTFGKKYDGSAGVGVSRYDVHREHCTFDSSGNKFYHKRLDF